MFKIKGEKKSHKLDINSEIQIYDTAERVWKNYTIREKKFLITKNGASDIEYWGIPQFSRQMENESLCVESRIAEHIEQNILRIVKK